MNRRILLIDADPSFQTELTVGVSRYRIDVVHEPDADEAIALGATEPVALVIVGVDEPDKYGFKTFQRLKRGPLAETPIMLVTSTVPAESFAKHRGLKVHADEYVDKRTAGTDELLAKIDALIGLGSPADDDLDIPVEVDDIPMDGPALDEELDDGGVHEFAGGQQTAMGEPDQRVDSAVDADIEDAFGSLMGDDAAPSLDSLAASPDAQRDTSQPHVIPRAPAAASPDDGAREFDDSPETRADIDATMNALRTERPTAPPPTGPTPAADALAADQPRVLLEAVPAPEPAADAEPAPSAEVAAPAPADDAPADAADADAVPGAVFDSARQDDDFETVSREVDRPAAAARVAAAPAPRSEEATQYAASAYESSPAIAIADDDLQEIADDDLQEVVDDDDDGAVPEPVPHPRSAEDAAEAAAAREASPAAGAPAARPVFVDAPTHSSLVPSAPDLGLDTVVADAQRDQSGLTDRRALRQIGELERQVAQLRAELDRARADADKASRGGGREREFMNLREKVLAAETELKKTRADLAARDRELGDAQTQLRDLGELRGGLETRLRELEQRLAADADSAAQQARAQAELAATIEGLERELGEKAQHLAAAATTREQLERELASERALREANAGDAERALREEREQLVARHQQELAAVRQELALQHAAALEQQRRELDTHHVGAIAAAIETTRKDVMAELDAGLAELKAQHAEDVARLRSDHEVELARKVVEQAAELQRVRDDHATKQKAAAAKADQLAAQLTTETERLQAALAEAEAARTHAIADLASRHASELERQTAAHAEALAAREHALEQTRADEARAHAAQVADLEQRLAAQAAEHAETLAARERALETTRQDEAVAYAAALAELEGQLEAQAAQHRAALEQAAEQHRTELAAHQEQAEREVAELRQAVSAAKRTVEDTTARAQAEHAALEDAHQRAIAELTAQHERAIAVANGEIVKVKAVADAERNRALKDKDAELERVRKELQAAHATELAEVRTERDQLERGLSAARDTIKRSEGELATAVQTIADRNAELRAAAAAIAERDQRLGELRKELETIEHENASYQEQVLRAYQKIKADEAMVARAKKAMAIALTVLDDPGTPKPSEPT